MEITVYNTAGTKEKVEKVSVKKDPLDPHLVWLLVKYQDRCAHEYTASSKTRSDVRGGGAKPHRQKGTGRARAGTNSSPLKVGGGVTFGPSPRTPKYKINRKVVIKALKSLWFNILDKVVIFDALSLDKISTKTVQQVFFKILKVNKFNKIGLILDSDEDVLIKSAANIKGVSLVYVNNLNASVLLSSEKIIVSKKAYGYIKERVL